MKTATSWGLTPPRDCRISGFFPFRTVRIFPDFSGFISGFFRIFPDFWTGHILAATPQSRCIMRSDNVKSINISSSGCFSEGFSFINHECQYCLKPVGCTLDKLIHFTQRCRNLVFLVSCLLHINEFAECMTILNPPFGTCLPNGPTRCNVFGWHRTPQTKGFQVGEPSAPP